MDLSLLSSEEKDWINARNAETLEKDARSCGK